MANSRQPAKRVLAPELTSAHLQVEGEVDDDEDDGDTNPPNFLVLPSGVGANRVLMVGVATEIEDVGQDDEYLRLRCSDPNGNVFYTYAGQYSKGPKATIAALEVPSRVAVIGKPKTYEQEGEVFVSLNPETVHEISEEEYDDMVVEAAEATVERFTSDQEDQKFEELAQSAHTDEKRLEVYDRCVEVLEAVHEGMADAPADDTFSEDELEQKGYDELRSLASEFDGISGNAAADDIVTALTDEPRPA
ncbi:DNA-binding protein [Haloarcula sp. Atlit-7R]|uniref:DNA-binding protein n=1 Tax=Haloarcula sp. Atlit-7R TaxID=2282125 RepID=UPI000EF132B4|nr:DNA-binding protein [Haloarcula sp. Atlit-7R]RLM94326.1 DNA-binding protein [Haloarcula sp. Atlit-7R]